VLNLISFTHKNALPADITSPNLDSLEIIQFKVRRYYFQLQGLVRFHWSKYFSLGQENYIKHCRPVLRSPAHAKRLAILFCGINLILFSSSILLSNFFAIRIFLEFKPKSDSGFFSSFKTVRVDNY
jgi:hypothetical protein